MATRDGACAPRSEEATTLWGNPTKSNRIQPAVLGVKLGDSG